MFGYSEEYYLRKQYLKNDQVPTQSMIRSKMKSPLADVYFKSMKGRTRVLAGLEPPMTGGGSNWCMPPGELLAGRAVLKPANKTHLIELGYNAFDYYAEKIQEKHQKSFATYVKTLRHDKDIVWKEYIDQCCRDQTVETALEQSILNKEKLQTVLTELSNMFCSTLNTLESVIMRAAAKDVVNHKNTLYHSMLEKHKNLVKDQAAKLYDAYENNLEQEKKRLKQEFVDECEQERLKVCERLHDINVEKHTVIEKLRHLLQCRNIACQVYIALKERDECDRQLLHNHNTQYKENIKKIKVLEENIEHLDLTIKLEIEKEKESRKINNIWKTKVCHIVQKFRLFVEYCLQMLPQHAAFFMNLENVMLLQMSKASENPSAESMFNEEAASSRKRPPQPQPHPYRLFCDKGFTPRPEQNLCPKHGTSSTSLLPVIVVNNRYFYSACDNLNTFTDKATKYISNQLDDKHMDDISDNDHVRVTCTPSQQLKELQLESSLMRLLQKDYPNIKNVDIECPKCKKAHCYGASPKIEEPVKSTTKLKQKATTSANITPLREMELMQNRLPNNIESYIKFTMPKKCECMNTISGGRKFANLPPYMKKTSKFMEDETMLSKYKICSLDTLRNLIKERRERESPTDSMSNVRKIETKDATTQYEDIQFGTLCKCVSYHELVKLLAAGRESQTKGHIELLRESSLNLSLRSFTAKRALTILNLLNDSPELMEIFKSENCNFDT